MAETRVNLIINAEVIAHRGPIDAPVFVSQACSGWVASGVTINPDEMCESALRFLAETEQLDRDQMDVVHFSWTELEYEVLPPPPPE